MHLQNQLLSVVRAPSAIHANHDVKDAPSSARCLSSNDERLIEALREGRAGAAEALYRRLYPAVSRTLSRILQQLSADHDDLVQITFERVIKTLIDGRFAGACSLPTWAASIAAHAALDHRRARTRENRLIGDSATANGWEGIPDSDIERSLEARSELAALQNTFARMSSKHVEILILHDVLGHTLIEIATLLRTSSAAAQSRLLRARQDLMRRRARKGSTVDDS